jgi:hypothetical protein
MYKKGAHDTKLVDAADRRGRYSWRTPPGQLVIPAYVAPGMAFGGS